MLGARERLVSLFGKGDSGKSDDMREWGSGVFFQAQVALGQGHIQECLREGYRVCAQTSSRKSIAEA